MSAITQKPNSELADFLNSFLADPAHTEEQIAKRFKVSVATVQKWRAGEFWENPLLAKRIIEILESGS